MKINSFAIFAVSVSSMIHHIVSAAPNQEQKKVPSSSGIRRTKKVDRPSTTRTRDQDHDVGDRFDGSSAGGANGATTKKGHAHDDRKDGIFAILLNGTFSGSNMTPDKDILPGEGFFTDDFFNNYTADDDFDFFEGISPPCPPKEVLVALNVTLEELGCESS